MHGLCKNSPHGGAAFINFNQTCRLILQMLFSISTFNAGMNHSAENEGVHTHTEREKSLYST